MKTVEYKGKKYNKYSKHWVDENYITVPLSIQNELNYAYYKTLDKDEVSLNDLIELGDEFKESKSFSLAIDVYLLASEKADEKVIKLLLPRMTSCYRNLNRPDLVIEILAIAKKKHGKQVLSPVLLTSAAAAYCDLEKYKEAKQCSYAMNKGKGSPELANVYKRIKANM